MAPDPVEVWALDMGLSACAAVGAELDASRRALQHARDKARRVAAANVAAGVPEAAVARAIGVTRATIRKWRTCDAAKALE